jgi:hypothetical protein
VSDHEILYSTAGGSRGSSAFAASVEGSANVYVSANQLPRSIFLQRTEQKGRGPKPSGTSSSAPQMGQWIRTGGV